MSKRSASAITANAPQETTELHFTHYREGTLGKGLAKAVDQLQQEGKLSAKVGEAILKRFDTSFAAAIRAHANNHITFSVCIIYLGEVLLIVVLVMLPDITRTNVTLRLGRKL